MTKPMMVFLAALIYVFVYSMFIEPNALEVAQYKIANKHLNGVRVVFLSDFHLKRHDYKRLDKIIKLTNKQAPDLVILGGDYFLSKDEKSIMNPNLFAQKFKYNISAPVYAVLGEYDYFLDVDKLKTAFEDNDVWVLEDEKSRVFIAGQYLDIIGLSDYKTKNPDVNKAMYQSLLPRIVVTHNPDVYYNIMDNVTAIFAGHTHGGQFIFPFTPPLFVPSNYGSEFASGEIQKTKNKMIISKGLGTTGLLPLRFKCKPEIVVVDFTSR